MRDQRGFMLIELLVAMLLLVAGVLALVGVLDASRRLGSVAARQTTMVHRAQQELEQIQSLPYSKVAMTPAAPPHSASAADPSFYVNAGPPATFQYDRLNVAATEPFAVDGLNGVIASTPTPWSDGRMSGLIYDFVTTVADPNCANGTNCPTAGDYKRVTVAITLTGATHPSRPVLVSTLIADPAAAATGSVVNGVQNPLQSPNTQCLNGQSVLVPCTNGLAAGNANTWYLYDTSATKTTGLGAFSAYNTVRQPITGSHAGHATVAVSNQLECLPGGVVRGCQNPDLMGSTTPTQDGPPLLTPYCYTNDTGCTGSPATGHPVGGRTMPPDTPCAVANPWSQTDNHKGAFWTTNGVSLLTTLTGSGGMTLYASTSSGVTASVTLCVGIYVMPASLLGLLTVPPVQIGVAAYAMAAFPAVPTPVSFNFDILAAGATYAVVAGSRIGVRLWVSSASATGVTLAYDHPEFQSALQLNSQ